MLQTLIFSQSESVLKTFEILHLVLQFILAKSPEKS